MCTGLFSGELAVGDPVVTWTLSGRRRRGGGNGGSRDGEDDLGTERVDAGLGWWSDLVRRVIVAPELVENPLWVGEVSGENVGKEAEDAEGELDGSGMTASGNRDWGVRFLSVVSGGECGPGKLRSAFL